MTVDAKPVDPINDFNNRYAKFRKKADKPAVSSEETPAEKKNIEKKKNNSTNDLSKIGALIEETKELNKGKGDEKMEKDDNRHVETFMPSGIQKWACLYAKIDYKDYKDETSLIKALEDKGVTIRGNDIIDKNMEMLVYTYSPTNEDERKNMESRKYSLRDDGYDVPALPVEENEELRFHEGTAKQETHKNEDIHWIDEKIADYTAMRDAGNTDIKEFVGDKTAGTFTAEVDNGTVTYTSPNDVSVTKDSSYKVFDTIMKEPSNAGKAVRIPAEASKEFKTNLFIAAILNGHKVNGAEGLELDEATLQKSGISEEQKAIVLAALQNKPEEKNQPKDEEKTEKIAENNNPSEKNDVEKRPAGEDLYTPLKDHRINHVFERKNMLKALKGNDDKIAVNADKGSDGNKITNAPVCEVRNVRIPKIHNNGKFFQKKIQNQGRE